MHKDSITNVPDEQYNGYAPYAKGGTWQIDDKGTRQVADRWECYFGGGETLDLDGDGVLDTCVKGEISIDGTRFWLYGLTKPILQVTNAMKNVMLDSSFHAGKLFNEYFRKYFQEEQFQNPFGQLFIKRIGDSIDYKFEYPMK